MAQDKDTKCLGYFSNKKVTDDSIQMCDSCYTVSGMKKVRFFCNLFGSFTPAVLSCTSWTAKKHKN